MAKSESAAALSNQKISLQRISGFKNDIINSSLITTGVIANSAKKIQNTTAISELKENKCEVNIALDIKESAQPGSTININNIKFLAFKKRTATLANRNSIALPLIKHNTRKEVKNQYIRPKKIPLQVQVINSKPKDDFKKVCRICLKNKTTPVYIFGDDKYLAKNIITFGDIEITDADPYPKYICISCCDLLRSAILFRYTAQKADKDLRSKKEVREDDSIIEPEHQKVNSNKPSDYNNITHPQDQINNKDNEELPKSSFKILEKCSEKKTVKIMDRTKPHDENYLCNQDRESIKTKMHIVNTVKTNNEFKVFKRDADPNNVKPLQQLKLTPADTALRNIASKYKEDNPETEIDTKFTDTNQNLDSFKTKMHIEKTVNTNNNFNVFKRDIDPNNEKPLQQFKLTPADTALRNITSKYKEDNHETEVENKFTESNQDPESFKTKIHIEKTVNTNNKLKVIKRYVDLNNVKLLQQLKLIPADTALKNTTSKFKADSHEKEVDNKYTDIKSELCQKNIVKPTDDNFMNQSVLCKEGTMNDAKIRKIEATTYHKPLIKENVIINDKVPVDDYFGDNSIPKRIIKIPPPTLQCDECGLDFRREKFVEHTLKTHPEKTKIQCKICLREFGVGYIFRHVLDHKEGPHICELCGKKLQTQQSFEYHLKTHSTEFPFKCTLCPYRTYNNTLLTRHTMRHFNVKPYLCSECPARFCQSGNLKTHMYKHTGERPFQCDTCKKSFVTKRSLKRHILGVHIGLMDQACRFCDKSFALISRRRTHERRMHRNKCKILPSGRMAAYLLHEEKMEYQQTTLNTRISDS